MNIEARLHDAMHEYADTIDPEPGSWSRISARFDDEPTPHRPAPRAVALVFAGVALLLVVALVAVLVVRDDSDDSTRVSTGPATDMPSRILALTTTGQPEVLNAATGRQATAYDTSGVAEGTQIAMTPDGQDAYVVQGSGNEGCTDHSILRLPVGAGARGGDEIATEATEPTVSPDGRYLAYLHCLTGDSRADEIVLRDLTTGVETVTTAPAGTFFISRLEFAPDSQNVYVNVFEDTLGRASLREIDVVAGGPAGGRFIDDSAAGWVGVRGTTGALLGVQSSPLRVVSLTPPAASPATRDPEFLIGGQFIYQPLFLVPRGPGKAPTQVVSDASGRHILMVLDRSLYRWSEGEANATKIADGVIGAAWIPDAPAAQPNPGRDARAVVVLGGDRVALSDGATGSVTRELFSHAAITSVTPAIDGKSVYVITNDPGPCRGGPEAFRVPLDGGDAKQVLTGVTSVREVATAAGTLLAYTGAIDCSDAGQVIRFGTLTDPGRGLSNPAEVQFPADTTALSILDASRDGMSLLVRVVRPGGASLRIVDVATGALAAVPGSESVTVAAFSGDAANAFLQIVREQNGNPQLDLINRQGQVVSSFAVPPGAQAIQAEPLRLLGVSDAGPSFVWRDGHTENLDLPDTMTAATWMPVAAEPSSVPTNMPNALLAAVDGTRLVFLSAQNGSEQTSYGTFPEISSVSVTPDGKAILFSHRGEGGACGSQPGPDIDRLKLDTGTSERIVGGAATPVVSPDGTFVAYGITCDGHTLGLTNLQTGQNYRTEPLGNSKAAATKTVEGVEVLGWSPDSKRMLYSALLAGDSSAHYYVGRLWPTVPQSQTEVIDLPGGQGITAATFIDNEAVALAETVGTSSQVRRFAVHQGSHEQRSSVLFQVRGRITSLVADPSGRHVLAVTDAGELYRWSIGESVPTRIADRVTAVSWAPWWGVSGNPSRG